MTLWIFDISWLSIAK